MYRALSSYCEKAYYINYNKNASYRKRIEKSSGAVNFGLNLSVQEAPLSPRNCASAAHYTRPVPPACTSGCLRCAKYAHTSGPDVRSVRRGHVNWETVHTRASGPDVQPGRKGPADRLALRIIKDYLVDWVSFIIGLFYIHSAAHAVSHLCLHLCLVTV